MTPERWKRVDELLSAVLDLDKDKRSVYLDEACGEDEELRKEVESLLASDEQESNSIERYPMELAANFVAEHGTMLGSGESIGPYKIQSMIGSGGMGEVYRASDSRIGREVALKILPRHFSQDSDRLRRFEQEAQAAGMLNHPNIVAIHDTGTYNGSPYLVSELLQGEVLQQKLKGHLLPVRKTIDYAFQIATGLSAAHEKGIIHRDLKPGNIFITKEGRVKLLDFGLAKLTHPDASLSSSLENTDLTETGVVLGTIVYMSPEQVTGRKVDRRSDIFAFGSVLYEMLSGKRPFSGDTQIEVMHAILKADPPELSPSNGSIPPSLERIARRCLEKDPDLRFQTTSDLAFAIESLSTASGTALAPIRQRKPMHLAWILSGILFVVAVILGAALYRSRDNTLQQENASSVQRLSIVLPENTVLNSSVISPDGRRVAYVTNTTTGFSKLWLRSLDSAEAEEIPGTEDATLPFWSPDSKAIGFFTEKELKIVTIGGGPPRTLYDDSIELPKGGTWNQFGDILFSPKSGVGLYRIPERGGEAVPFTQLDESRAEVRHLFPEFLSNGRHFFYLVRSPKQDSAVVYIGSLDSKEKKLLFPELTPVRFADPGHLFFVRNRKLMVQSFDPKQLQLTGEAITLANSFSNDVSGPNFSVSKNNILVYGKNDRWLSQPVWFDRSGKQKSPLKNSGAAVGQPGNYKFCDLSPDDGRLLTFWNEVLWMLDLSTGDFSRYAITNETDLVYSPIDAAFSPDGSQVAYVAFDKSTNPVGNFHQPGLTSRMYIKPSNGFGKAKFLHQPILGVNDITWSADGKFLTFTGVNVRAKTLFDLWALPLQGDPVAFDFYKGPSRDEAPVLSPDGKWVAYHSYESGIPEIYVRSFPAEAGGVWAISTGGAERPIWRRDGRELFYLTLDKKMMATEILPGETFQTGVTRFLFQTHAQPRINPWGIGPTKHYFVSADGNHFLINTMIDKTSPTEINVLIHWESLLKK